MTPEFAQIIVATLSLIGVIITGCLAYLTNKKVKAYHKEVNGRMDELIDTTKQIATMKERKRKTKQVKIKYEGDQAEP